MQNEEYEAQLLCVIARFTGVFGNDAGKLHSVEARERTDQPPRTAPGRSCHVKLNHQPSCIHSSRVVRTACR